MPSETTKAPSPTLAAMREDFEARARDHAKVAAEWRESGNPALLPGALIHERNAAEARAIASALADSERYAFLRDTLYHGDFEVGEAYVRMKVVGSCPSPEEFDAAVDAARLASGGES